MPYQGIPGARKHSRAQSRHQPYPSTSVFLRCYWQCHVVFCSICPTPPMVTSKRLPSSIHNQLARPTHQHTQQPPTSTLPPGQQTRTELNLPTPSLPKNISTSRQHPPAKPICTPPSPPRNLRHAPLAEENTPNPTIATD